MADTTTANSNVWSDLIAAVALTSKCSAGDLSPFRWDRGTMVVLANPERFTEDELAQLEEWGFFAGKGDEEGAFYSCRYGNV